MGIGYDLGVDGRTTCPTERSLVMREFLWNMYESVCHAIVNETVNMAFPNYEWESGRAYAFAQLAAELGEEELQEKFYDLYLHTAEYGQETAKLLFGE